MQTMTTLNLRSNRIGSIGAQYLGDAMKINKVRRDLFRSNGSLAIRFFTDTRLTQSGGQPYWGCGSQVYQ